jgi:hypothetical protein
LSLSSLRYADRLALGSCTHWLDWRNQQRNDRQRRRDDELCRILQRWRRDAGGFQCDDDDGESDGDEARCQLPLQRRLRRLRQLDTAAAAASTAAAAALSAHWAEQWSADEAALLQSETAAATAELSAERQRARQRIAALRTVQQQRSDEAAARANEERRRVLFEEDERRRLKAAAELKEKSDEWRRRRRANKKALLAVRLTRVACSRRRFSVADGGDGPDGEEGESNAVVLLHLGGGGTDGREPTAITMPNLVAYSKPSEQWSKWSPDNSAQTSSTSTSPPPFFSCFVLSDHFFLPIENAPAQSLIFILQLPRKVEVQRWKEDKKKEQERKKKRKSRKHSKQAEEEEEKEEEEEEEGEEVEEIEDKEEMEKKTENESEAASMDKKLEAARRRNEDLTLLAMKEGEEKALTIVSSEVEGTESQLRLASMYSACFHSLSSLHQLHRRSPPAHRFVLTAATVLGWVDIPLRQLRDADANADADNHHRTDRGTKSWWRMKGRREWKLRMLGRDETNEEMIVGLSPGRTPRKERMSVEEEWKKTTTTNVQDKEAEKKRDYFLEVEFYWNNEGFIAI